MFEEQDHAADAAGGTSAEVLYAVELVHDRGTYTVLVRDLAQGTLQTTTIPGRTVARIPVYLSKLGLETL
ncbi:hypothetical protein ACIBSV_36700 [Embleya sp. NPDC050154]|uniref:hypothetical protein n=1 Tax=Embleya sp. NPDC050154 TaxID=3363988 RepID=UPI0037998567